MEHAAGKLHSLAGTKFVFAGGFKGLSASSDSYSSRRMTGRTAAFAFCFARCAGHLLCWVLTGPQCLRSIPRRKVAVAQVPNAFAR